MNIVDVGYDSTHYYVLGAGTSRLMVDVGMPGTFGELSSILRRKDIPIASIGYLLVTHFHPDHAGIAQEMKAAGVRLVVLDVQRSAIAPLNLLIERHAADPRRSPSTATSISRSTRVATS